MRNASITGWGKCVPPAILTNDEIATVIDTSDDWIKSRSGIVNAGFHTCLSVTWRQSPRNTPWLRQVVVSRT